MKEAVLAFVDRMPDMYYTYGKGALEPEKLRVTPNLDDIQTRGPIDD